MYIGWKIFLPLTLGFVFFFSGVLWTADSLEISSLPRMGSAFNYLESLSIRF
jgi:hypothetical protein